MINRNFKYILILVSLLYVIISIINLNTVALQMSDENIYANRNDNVVFIDIVPGGVSDLAGLQVDDILLKINGKEITSALNAQTYLDNAKPGESLIYTIERSGRVFDVKVDLALAGLRIWHFGSLLAGIIFFGFALWIGLSKPENRHARLMSIGAILFSAILINIQTAGGAALDSIFYQVIVLSLIGSLFFAVATATHASLNFPERKYEKTKPFLMIYAHYILAGISYAGAIFIFYSNLIQIPFQALLIFPLLYILIIEFTFWRKRRKEYKARSKAFLIVISIMICSYILAMFLATRTGYAEYLSFSILLLPLSYIFTTVKYRVYDIHLRWRLSLFYNFLQTILILGFVISIFLIVRYLPLWQLNLPAVFLSGTSIEFYDMQSLAPDLHAQVSMGYQILIGIILAFAVYESKNIIKQFLDRMFFQQKYDYKIALKNFSEILSSSLTRDEISRNSVKQICDVMKLKGTMIAIAENHHFKISNTTGTLSGLDTQNFYISGDLNQKLIINKEQIFPEDFKHIDLLNKKNKEIMCGIPITTSNNNLEAILFTGEKLSESPYNNEDVEILNYFSEHLGTAYERAQLYEDMADKERIKRELEIAREMQLNSLPKCEPDYSGLQICASLSAAHEVGGDYYDYIEIDQDNLGIIVGDVLGKGASAAFHMSRIQGFIQSLATQMTDPADLLERLNSLIQKNFDPEFFFTALYGLFNTKSNLLDIYRLGHNGLIYFNSETNKISIIEPPGIGLGMTESEKFRAELKPEQIKYKTGDIFVFLTDGFLEAMNFDMLPFGEKRIVRIIEENYLKSASEIMDVLTNEVKIYSDNRQFDDTTGIVVKIKN
jgi:serine phosphatase RsbU (regulator of sigma subunit)